jgi:hypothetical protein
MHFIFSLFAFAYASELPVLKVPAHWRQCEVASDCAVAGDGCRSCGAFDIINKKFLKEFQEFDQKARRKAGFARACEACSTAHVNVVCREKKCGYEKAPEGGR